ncbi:prophage CP4-57 integrase [Geobacter sp. OR-1]|uniref:tyrosine-type recombinase/integrase n=1 Tax=Geobacter sp. OR-1 TaxID=1266765 RepID=UPI000541E674|nr:site-specific integrase [Geobacter sp. OR-1]GAM11258.1 prophage CP4-57 integrase [Geobacter sp. OR-1]
MKFTDKLIGNLKPQEKKYYVRESKGFSIRVLPTGVKTWLFIYNFDGKRREMNLGIYPTMSLADARTAYSNAYSILHDKQNPRDPQEERDQKHAAERQAREDRDKHPTVGMLVTEYIRKVSDAKNEHANPLKTSWEEDQRILNKDVVPVWGERKVEDITRKDVLRLLDNMQGRGNGIITNTFKIIRRMFRYAVKQEIIVTTPCYAFERGEELPRPVSKERNLTEEEVKAFLTGIDNTAISGEIRNILKLILLTGQRPGEVTAMHASEINGKWWEFTPKETKITKEIPRKQRIYLTEMALSLIGDTKGKGYLFPSPITKLDDNDKVIDDCITERAVSAALRRNLLTHEVKPKPATWKKAVSTAKNKFKRKQFIVPDEKKLGIAKFTPHDLRRTCATMISEIGYPDEVVDAILAHLKKGEIRTYNKNKYDRDKQMAMEAWERKLNSIVTNTESNVIPITAGRKSA